MNIKLEDLLKTVESFEKLKNLISEVFFQGQEPYWLHSLIIIILGIIIVLVVAFAGLIGIGPAVKIWMEQIRPLYYNQDEKKRKIQRQRFASYIEQRNQQINDPGQWQDHRFTELEAEVEAEGQHRQWIWIPFKSEQRGLRRESSLSKALIRSNERLILVEGEPGSGKSVALKHIAKKLSQRAVRDKKLKSIIPLYIDLKKLEHLHEDAIDKNLIESFVIRELNRINDRDVEKFLQDEFNEGMKEKTWLFLFDSFNEIPAVLSSVEADRTIKKYADAIRDFLSGFNKCQGIVASRQFHGPNNLGWPKIRILPLDSSRRRKFIQKMKFSPEVKKTIMGEIDSASQEIQDMAKNPMFLKILCTNLQNNYPLPKNIHTVFENYLEQRFSCDADRLQRCYGFTPSELRVAAEKIAFCMLNDSTLGLSPGRNSIVISMGQQGFLFRSDLGQYLDALEDLKIAHSGEPLSPGNPRTFTFSHHRFQEYFATCFVLDNLNRVSPQRLLTDGRWRESVVVIFQTQPFDKLAYLLKETRKILDEKLQANPEIINDPLRYIEEELTHEKTLGIKNFIWPNGLHSLFMILQSGFIARHDLPEDIQGKSGQFLLTASVQGTRSDRKRSLEVAGITPEPIFLYLLRYAFSSESQWLKGVAYRRISYLKNIPDDIATEIRKSLLYLYCSNRLNKDFYATYAYISRLENPSIYIRSINILKNLRFYDTIWHLIIGLLLLLLHPFNTPFNTLLVLAPLFIISILLRKDLHSLVGGYQEFHKENPSTNIAKVSLAIYIRIIFIPLTWSIFTILSIRLGDSIGLISCLLLLISLPVKKIKMIWQYFVMLIKTGWLLFVVTLITIPWVFQNSFQALNILVAGLFFLLSCSIMSQSFCNYFLWRRDLKKWKKWNKEKPFSITVQDFLKLIDSYHYPEFCRKLIVAIRKNDQIEIDVEELLPEIALTLERSILSRKMMLKQMRTGEKDTFKTPLHLLRFFWKAFKSRKNSKLESNNGINSYQGSSDFLRSWLNQYTIKHKMRFVNLGDEFIDELYILIEQLKSREKISSEAILNTRK